MECSWPMSKRNPAGQDNFLECPYELLQPQRSLTPTDMDVDAPAETCLPPLFLILIRILFWLPSLLACKQALFCLLQHKNVPAHCHMLTPCQLHVCGFVLRVCLCECGGCVCVCVCSVDSNRNCHNLRLCTIWPLINLCAC